MQIFETLQLLIEAPRMNFCQSTIARRIILISFTQQCFDIFGKISHFSGIVFLVFLFLLFFALSLFHHFEYRRYFEDTSEWPDKTIIAV